MFCQWPGKPAGQRGVLGGQVPGSGVLIISPGYAPIVSFVKQAAPIFWNQQLFCWTLSVHWLCFQLFLFPVFDGILLRSNLWISAIRWPACSAPSNDLALSHLPLQECSPKGCLFYVAVTTCVLSIACWIRAWLLLDNPSRQILHQVQAFLALTLGGLGLTREQMLRRRASLTCTTAIAPGVWLLSCRFPEAEDRSAARSGVWTWLLTSVLRRKPEMISSDSVNLDFVWPVTAKLQCLFLRQCSCREGSSYWGDSSCGLDCKSFPGLFLYN